MDCKVLDREFRDYTSELKYPFSDKAVLSSLSGFALPPSVFLDMVVYVPEDVALPVYLSAVYGTDDREKATVELKSAGNDKLAEFVIDTSSDHCDIIRNGGCAGSVVYNPAEASSLIYAAAAGGIFFGTNLPLQTGRCFTYSPDYITGVKASSVLDSGGVVTGDVYILAASGAAFEEDPDNPGSFFLNVYGEDPATGMPVLSVNGIKRQHLWVVSPPDSGIKTETIEHGIKIRSILDE